MYPIELIPDADLLYRFINKVHISSKGKVKPRAFRVQGEGDDRGLSTDWRKYSTPDQTKNRTRVPEHNGVVSFVTGNFRKANLQVVHAPVEGNQAHTNVKGQEEEVRLKAMDLFKWEIKPPVPVLE